MVFLTILEGLCTRLDEAVDQGDQVRHMKMGGSTLGASFE